MARSPRPGPDIVIAALGKLAKHGLDVGGIAATAGGPRSRCRQPGPRNDAAALPRLRRASHQPDGHGAVEGWRLRIPGIRQAIIAETLLPYSCRAVYPCDSMHGM
jgi:hypothetical protein